MCLGPERMNLRSDAIGADDTGHSSQICRKNLSRPLVCDQVSQGKATFLIPEMGSGTRWIVMSVIHIM
ncbi:hypothetical protein BJX66DRAFT_320029 [Aspergillus keveii]|uniref:Uncharacterized protein n=1 Tax=Aspergillus keveii TaxID=714993 RepID=A0ABR4FHL0_9EURO